MATPNERGGWDISDEEAAEVLRLSDERDEATADLHGYLPTIEGVAAAFGNMPEDGLPENRALPACYAYNKAGQRCMNPAGHYGRHGVIFEWGDDECWAPIAGTVLIGPAGVAGVVPEPTRIDLVDVPRGSGKCVICEHRMHIGMCGAAMPDSEHGCDCSNGVEE